MEALKKGRGLLTVALCVVTKDWLLGPQRVGVGTVAS
jgi:hypothetical protein